MDMYNWIDKVIYSDKKPMPLLSYPATDFLYITVKELVDSSSQQAIGMRLIADRYDMLASISYMDLSVEAEAFGAHTVYAAEEVPTIIGKLIDSQEDADALKIPEVGAGRTGVCIDAIRKARNLISDRPVFANCIGPFSLAGRLMNVNDILLSCYTDPEVVHTVLEKATQFIISYASALKEAGANGCIIAEPLAGLLSPDLMTEFSTNYIRRIVDALQDKHFIFIYHNCGSYINQLVDQMLETGCRAYHFGESADMPMMLEKIPGNYLVFGNLSPSKKFNHATPEETRLATLRLLRECTDHNNFVISSGCDLPPCTDLDNIDIFFSTVQDFYYRRKLWDIIG